jgi:hypothetical protein
MYAQARVTSEGWKGRRASCRGACNGWCRRMTAQATNAGLPVAIASDVPAAAHQRARLDRQRQMTEHVHQRQAVYSVQTHILSHRPSVCWVPPQVPRAAGQVGRWRGEALWVVQSTAPVTHATMQRQPRVVEEALGEALWERLHPVAVTPGTCHRASWWRRRRRRRQHDLAEVCERRRHVHPRHICCCCCRGEKHGEQRGERHHCTASTG